MASSEVPTGRRMKGSEMFMAVRPAFHPRGCRGGSQPAAACRLRTPVAEPVQVKINDRGGVERDELGEQQAADDGDAERTAQFRAGAVFHRERQRAEQRGHGGHHDRPEPQQAGLVDGFLRRRGLSLRSASRAKSIIMMAFFWTMPMSRMMPIMATRERSMADHEGQQRAHARRGQAGKDGDRDGCSSRKAHPGRCR